MNNLDIQYQSLLIDILGNGVIKSDRTGTGTTSVFGRQIRHKMSEGFPLLTTKKMHWKSIVTELLWFLRGDTNIKFLLDYDCHIWDGDAYKNYVKNHKDNLVGSDIILPNGETAKITGQHTVNKNVLLTTKGRINIEGDDRVKILDSDLSKDEFINKIKNDNEFAKIWGELGPIYGKQWRSWERYGYRGVQNGALDCGLITQEEADSKMYIDQIQNLINELKTNPDSRRLMVSAWNVGELENMVLPPCHYGFQVYTRELSWEERRGMFQKHIDGILTEEWANQIGFPTRAISLMWNQRSVDTFLGLPFNIASYGLLLEIIAKEVNMVPDELIGNLGDVHLYSNHIEQAKEQISREPFELPKVKITERNWYMHEAVKEHLGEKTLDEKLKSYRPDCFELIGYQSHPKIKAPLSN